MEKSLVWFLEVFNVLEKTEEKTLDSTFMYFLWLIIDKFLCMKGME